ncbi:MAG: sensor histidine kinase [Anaerolineae bacterium]|nr:sensor histidine kinase [Anaerolineae bacterium]
MTTSQISKTNTKTGGGIDLAFAVVVLAAYFTTFSATRQATVLQIILLIGLGIFYVAMGIYGYAYISHSLNTFYHLAYFAVQLPVAGLIIFLGKGVSYNAMILLPLAGHSVMLMSQDRMMLANVAIGLTYLVSEYVLGYSWGEIMNGFQIFLAGQIFIVAFTQIAINEEKNRKEAERLAADLAEANQRLRLYAFQVEELAITKERNRLAREIHDGLGHFLTTIHMQIQAARAIMPTNPEKAMLTLAQAQNLTQEALADVRQSVSTLRASPVETLPLEESIHKLIENCKNSGVSTELKVSGEPFSLVPQKQLSIYRAAQEGINNALKHAQASHIWLHLDYTQVSSVRLVVSDDGLGANNLKHGFGLMGLQERMHLLGGEMRISTNPGSGFTFEIVVPV